MVSFRERSGCDRAGSRGRVSNCGKLRRVFHNSRPVPLKCFVRVGLNPYGLTFTTGLQGLGTTRANPHPIGMVGFIALSRDVGARCIELDHRWLRPLSLRELAELREQ